MLPAAWSLCQFEIGSVGSLNWISDDSLKGNPAVPGGWLKSRPTWSKPFRGFGHVGFFFALKAWHLPMSQ